MSLWVLIRKDEERMSYAENYFFFNSISKRKIRLGEIICKAEKSKVKKFILSSFSWKCDKSMVFNECWCYYLPRGLRWLWKQPFILVGNPASVPSSFFFILFSAEKIRQLFIFLNTNLVSQGVPVRFFFIPAYLPALGIDLIHHRRPIFPSKNSLFFSRLIFWEKSFCSIVLILGMRVHQASFESSYSV